MKKIGLIILVIFIYVLIGKITVEKDVIPDDAIRIRILANSNSNEDQMTKMKLKSEIEPYLYDLLKDAKNTNDAKNIINQNM